MKKDFAGRSHCYDLQKGQFIQGLIVRNGNEHRLYVVTIEPEPEDMQIHSRRPRVFNREKKHEEWCKDMLKII